MSEESFFSKAKRTVTGFLRGAIKAAPATLLYSASAFGLSYLGSQFGLDPLGVASNTGQQIATRLLGSMIIGSTLSGAIGGYEELSKPAPTVAAPSTPARPVATVADARQQSTDIGMGDAPKPSYTPTIPRDTQRAIS
jgi:hypothetical protein